MAQIGHGQLPLGIEWALLHLNYGIGWINWDRPISARKELLDPRFTKCGPDSIGLYYLRITIVEIDTTARSQKQGVLAEIRTAIVAFQLERWSQAATLLKELVRKRPNAALLRVFYAGALQRLDNQSEYDRQAHMLAGLGYGESK